MIAECGHSNCRGLIRPEDFEKFYQQWDYQIKAAMKKMFAIEQPLMKFIDTETKTALNNFSADDSFYKSVYALKMKDSINQSLIRE